MDFGISFLPDCGPETKSGAQFFEEAISLSVEAEKLGYSHTKITEHYLHPYGGYCPDPLMFLSAVAARTRKIRLMTGGIIAPFTHPIQIASKIAMADAISNGRIEAGFVRGYLPFEYDALGVDLDESKGRAQETIQAVDRLLHNGAASAEGPYFEFEEVSILPRPTQDRIPIWCASTSESSVTFAAENRFDLAIVLAFTPPASIKPAVELYRGLHPSGRLAVFAPLVLDKDPHAAEEVGHLHLRRYHAVWADAAKSWTGRSSTDYDPMYGRLTAALESITPEAMKEMKTTYFGAPDDVRRRMDETIEILGPSRILWNVDIGSMPLERSMNTIRLFSDEILGHYA